MDGVQDKPIRKRKRDKKNTRRACHNCRTKHLRCTADTPCEPCVQSGMECDRLWTWVNTVKHSFSSGATRRRSTTKPLRRESGVVPSQRKKSQDVPSQQQNAVKASPHQPPHLGSDRDVTARTPEDTLAPIDLPDIDSDDDEALRQPEHSPDSPARERTPSVFSSESDDDEEMITIVATKRATKPVPGLWKPNSADAANIEALWTETLTGKEKGSMYLIPEQLDSHLGWADRKTRRTDSEAKYIERLWTETLTNKSDAPMYLIEEQLDTRLGWTPAPQVDSPPSDSGSSEGETFEECSPSSGTSHAVSDQTSSSTSRPNDGQKCYSLDDMLWNNHNPYCT